ncbi:hypothetical protein NQD34_001357 [Periophthalmus magnuspinnatus]|nr:hypothetical protein NQD34_001357 [Periophthalmus magnuspinnatus]
MLRMFYESMVASAIMYAVVCWGSLRVRDTNRLNKIIRKAGHVVGEELDSLTVVSDRRMLAKIRTILDSPFHPLHKVLANQKSSFSHRLLLPRCSTERQEICPACRHQTVQLITYKYCNIPSTVCTLMQICCCKYL